MNDLDKFLKKPNKTSSSGSASSSITAADAAKLLKKVQEGASSGSAVPAAKRDAKDAAKEHKAAEKEADSMHSILEKAKADHDKQAALEAAHQAELAASKTKLAGVDQGTRSAAKLDAKVSRAEEKVELAAAGITATSNNVKVAQNQVALYDANTAAIGAKAARAKLAVGLLKDAEIQTQNTSDFKRLVEKAQGKQNEAVAAMRKSADAAKAKEAADAAQRLVNANEAKAIHILQGTLAAHKTAGKGVMTANMKDRLAAKAKGAVENIAVKKKEAARLASEAEKAHKDAARAAEKALQAAEDEKARVLKEEAALEEKAQKERLEKEQAAAEAKRKLKEEEAAAAIVKREAVEATKKAKAKADEEEAVRKDAARIAKAKAAGEVEAAKAVAAANTAAQLARDVADKARKEKDDTVRKEKERHATAVAAAAAQAAALADKKTAAAGKLKAARGVAEQRESEAKATHRLAENEKIEKARIAEAAEKRLQDAKHKSAEMAIKVQMTGATSTANAASVKQAGKAIQKNPTEDKPYDLYNRRFVQAQTIYNDCRQKAKEGDRGEWTKRGKCGIKLAGLETLTAGAKGQEIADLDAAVKGKLAKTIKKYIGELTVIKNDSLSKDAAALKEQKQANIMEGAVSGAFIESVSATSKQEREHDRTMDEQVGDAFIKDAALNLAMRAI